MGRLGNIQGLGDLNKSVNFLGAGQHGISIAMNYWFLQVQYLKLSA
jgi:hypothetical protein